MATHQKKPRKSLLIVWKWRDLTSLNQVLLAQEPQAYEKYLSGIKTEAEEGAEDRSFFKVYPVVKSDLCPDACVIAASIYKDGEQTQKLLDALIERYAEPEVELMLFLHRAHFYDEKDVDRLLTTFKGHISKCFLFADGRDYIYYKTQKSGILDDIGSFFSGRDLLTGEKVNILHNGVVAQPYFDRVWQYYNIEFETKLFQFKEELWDQWLPFLLPGRPGPISSVSLKQALEKDKKRVLFYRLKSLLGMYHQMPDATEEDGENWEADQQRKQEEKAIAELEKADRRSYTFDDCIRNLEHQKEQESAFIAGAYEELREAFKNTLFDKEQHDLEKAKLLDLADKMDYLIKIIPGELD